MASRHVVTETLAVSKLPHIRVLDGIRAVAIGIVMVSHTYLLPRFPGGLGVTIFFFLSGYLITSLMRLERQASGTLSLRGFYARRLLRIQPPLLISMAVVGTLIGVGLIGSDLSAYQVIGQVLLITNYLPTFGQNGGLPMPLWSLAVEEHFYLVFPLFYKFIGQKMTSRNIAWVCLAVCAVVLGIRVVNVLVFEMVLENYYYTHTRIDSILFGCVLALWHNPVLDHGAWRPGRLAVAGAGSLILGSLVIGGDLFREGIRYTVQGMALFVLFSWVLQDRGLISRLLQLKLVQLVGLYSYTLYLIHYPLQKLVIEQFPGLPIIVQVACGMVLSMAFAAAMHRLVERPLAKLRHRMNRVQNSGSRPVENTSAAHEAVKIL